MKTFTVFYPDEFTAEQVEFLKKSVQLQIEAEIKKELVVPQATVDAVEAKIASVREATAIKNPILTK